MWADQTWVVDAAINPVGVRAALEWCRRTVGEPSRLLLSIPDSKDLDGCVAALRDAPVQLVRCDVPHLTFSARADQPKPPTLGEIDLPGLGDIVLAVGTISFVGETLDVLDADTTRLF
jgi:hypothetical protein